METIKLIQSFNDKKILVLGDLILDEYVDGNCSRYAAEANIPIMDVRSRERKLGAAGNVAANLAALGADTTLCTVVGDDIDHNEMSDLLRAHNIRNTKIGVQSGRKTQVKTRLSIDNNLLYRIDRGCTSPIDDMNEKDIITFLKTNIHKYDGIVLSDYNKGVITYKIIDVLADLQLDLSQFVALDGRDYHKYARVGLTLITPNYEEALNLTKEKERANRIEQIAKWGTTIYEATRSKYCSLTLDKDGAVFFNDGEYQFHAPTELVDRPYVCGAGDTFVATQTLALLAGATFLQSLELANKASTVCIKKQDTAICSQGELIYEILKGKTKLVKNIDSLRAVLDQSRESKTIIFTNGCFDIFHSGHVNYLRKAKDLGDILIVAINTDDSVTRLKGESRPINKLKDRIAVLEELSCVDYIVPFGASHSDSPSALIETLRPHVYVKGHDYKNKRLKEKSALEKIACDIQFMPLVPHQSTTKIINRAQAASFVGLQKSS